MSLVLESPSRALASGAHPAIFVTFLAFGAATGLWGGSLPEVVRQAGVTPRLLGAALTVFMLAYIVSMSSGGWLARRVSLKRILLVSLPAQGLALAALLQAPSAQLFFAAFAVFGLITGLIDLVMNAEGTRVEADKGRPILAGLHGGASLGMAIGALSGGWLAANLGTWAVSMLGAALFALAVLMLATGTPDRGIDPPRGVQAAGGGGRLILALLGVVVGISMAGEMTASAWSAPLLIEQAPDFAAWAGTGAAVFALAQALIRFQADPLRRRFGDPLLLVLSLAVALVGLAIVTVSPTFAVSAAGFGLIGLGTACVVPCGFATAVARSPLAPSASLALVAFASALPRLPTPYLVGEIVTRASIGAAFGMFAALFLVAIGIGLSLRRSEPAGA